jgi:hypothetical protein
MEIDLDIVIQTYGIEKKTPPGYSRTGGKDCKDFRENVEPSA